MIQSGQKFLGKNRAPRVQIEYDVETGGAQIKKSLPFVMGVMSNLSGNPSEALPAVADRKMLEFDVDNFTDRMKAIKPRAAFNVENTLTGDGNLNVDLTFESMDDFSPEAIAKRVDGLSNLYEARTQLKNLLTYIDGRANAEALIGDLLKDPTTLQALASGAAEGGGEGDAPAAEASPESEG